MLEACLALGAFGVGLGFFINHEVEGLPYLIFLAPGVVMSSVLFTSTIESMMGTFVRMHIERTFESIIATPISIEEVVTGEIMWASTRATLTGGGVLLVTVIFQLSPSWWAIVMLPFFFIAGFMLSSLTTIVIALTPRMSSFSYFISLGIYPMQLFSGIFFPLSLLPAQLYWIPYISPLYPAVTVARDLFVGRFSTAASLVSVLWCLLLAVCFYLIALTLMRRRLLR